MSEQKGVYLIHGAQSVDEVAAQMNLILDMISERLDGIEGFRGTPTFRADIDLGGNAVTNAKDAVSPGDLVPKRQADASMTASLAAALQQVYPVGRLYLSTDSTDPAEIFGFGTWEAFGAGKVLVGVDESDSDFDTAEKTAGAKTVSIGHTHPAGTDVQSGSGETVNDGAYVGTVSTLQPSIAVYIWKRTA